MPRAYEFKDARADRLPKGTAKARRAAQKECRVCWVTGGHDPRCPKVGQAAAMQAAKGLST